MYCILSLRCSTIQWHSSTTCTRQQGTHVVATVWLCIHVYIPTLSCLVQLGVTGHDVTVNNKGGATCNNNKKITWRFFTCHKIDSNFAIILPQKPWTQSLMPLSLQTWPFQEEKGLVTIDPILGSPKLAVSIVEQWWHTFDVALFLAWRSICFFSTTKKVTTPFLLWEGVVWA